MAYYDQGFNVGAAYGTGPRTGAAEAVLGGLKAGQGLRKGALDNKAAQQKMDQQAVLKELSQKYNNSIGQERAVLGQQLNLVAPEQYKAMLGNDKMLQEQETAKGAKMDEFLARGAHEVLSAPEEVRQEVYSKFIKKGMAEGYIPESREDDTLDADDLEIMSQMVNRGRDFKDVVESDEIKGPMSTEGKIQADIDAGRISKEVGQGAIKKALTSSGFSVEFGEDGRVINITQGADSGLQKPTKSKIEEKAFNAAEMGARVKDIKTSFKPEYLELLPRGKMAFASMKDFLGQDLSAGETQKLTEFTTFKRRSVENLSRLLNELSGAAINAEEFRRLSATMPSSGTGIFDGDSPTVFKAKMVDVLKQSRLANLRYNYALSHGLNPLKSNIALADIPEMIDKRGGEIERELQTQMEGATEQQIETETRKRLITEFGMQ